MKRSQGMPAWVDFATDPCTSKWKTDFALPARSSVSRRQRALPMRAAPLPTSAVADEIDVGVILVGRPMALEIVEEGGPVGLQSMRLEIAQRKREAVVDADQRGRVLGQPFHQPFGDAASRPVFAERWRRQNLDRRRIALGQIDAQALQARGRRLRARIVDADVSGECGHLTPPP